ncbi:hypothetical protein GCK72_024076 [Caenorhabditis remanei]|uniref:Uncharacterized protein n=1 Tax=Caenorhabditis remanei TaxID=31234 RepID=A0A6A5FYT7_CAERE|nr:hypothetical protein GCK72_024076 [Caenorhabditis remanei]KAF1747611.1 hypothetical protein GCK72_024076 [Caenorhabditis remanei]
MREMNLNSEIGKKQHILYIEMAAKQKVTVANKFYEDWMDYKNRERRASSATTETIQSLKNGKYQLYDEYKARLSKTPASFGKRDTKGIGLKIIMIVVLQSSTPTPTPPQPVVSTSAKAKRQSLPIIQPIRERKISPKPAPIDWDNLSGEMKSKIEADFGPFYKWVINGRTDDLKKEIIKKLLFKTTK